MTITSTLRDPSSHVECAVGSRRRPARYSGMVTGGTFPPRFARGGLRSVLPADDSFVRMFIRPRHGPRMPPRTPPTSRSASLCAFMVARPKTVYASSSSSLEDPSLASSSSRPPMRMFANALDVHPVPRSDSSRSSASPSEESRGSVDRCSDTARRRRDSAARRRRASRYRANARGTSGGGFPFSSSSARPPMRHSRTRSAE